MLKFIAGLGCAILGLIVWVVASVSAGLTSATDCLDRALPTPNAVGSLDFTTYDKCNAGLFSNPVAGTIVVIGFAVMIGGPLLFWLVLPVVGFVRRRSARTPVAQNPEAVGRPPPEPTPPSYVPTFRPPERRQ